MTSRDALVKKRRIMMVAGEASGDMYGARLVSEALLINPEIDFFGIGGSRMREAGVTILVDAAEIAVVGLVEVIAHFDVIKGAFTRLREIIRKDPPDLLILIDYPDFNMLLAGIAKRNGVKVLYYISPQVWAWRKGRVNRIARLVDRIGVLFPFEVPLYKKAGADVVFVGHPLVDMVKPTMTNAEARSRFGFGSSDRIVGLFPGSRRGEIRWIFPTILETAKRLLERFPDISFVLPLASSLNRADLEQQIAQSGLEITLIDGYVYDVIQVCDAILTVSGTVTLEIALMGTPMVIIYKVSPITYFFGKLIVKIEHAGMCNIVAGERLVPELIQDEAMPSDIAVEVGRMLEDAEYNNSIRQKLLKVRGLLGDGGGSERIARLAIDLIEAGKG